MKFWAWGAVVLSVAALTACKSSGTSTTSGGEGGSGGSGGGGSTTTGMQTTSSGNNTTSSSMSTSTMSSMSTSSSMGNGCDDGSDCSQCADFQGCAQCEAGNNPQGAQVYDAFVTCVLCTACYNACDGATAGCPMAPGSKDACDSDAPSDAACGDSMNGCIACAQGDGASCADEVDACKNSSDCIDFATALQGCPQ